MSFRSDPPKPRNSVFAFARARGLLSSKVIPNKKKQMVRGAKHKAQVARASDQKS